MRGLQVAVEWPGWRWEDRIVAAEDLISEGRFDEAVSVLERMDRLHPARNVRHGRDQERQQILKLLGQSYEALGRRGRAIETYQRLVAFDPNHYRNHFELARASDRLLSRATMAPEAFAAYMGVLDLFPAHLPSVRGEIEYHLGQGEFIPIVEGYERYLDAFLVQSVQVMVGEMRIDVPVLVDGRPRSYEIPIVPSALAADDLTIATGGFSASIHSIELHPASRAGIMAPIGPVPMPVADPGLVEFARFETDTYRALGPSSALRYQIPEGIGPIEGVLLEITLFKPVDRELWAVVSKSYENLLNETGRVAAEGRTVPFASSQDADAVLERLAWARGGIFRHSSDRQSSDADGE